MSTLLAWMFTGRRRRRHKRRGRRRRRHKRRGSEKLIQIFRVVSSVTNQLSRIPRDVPRDKGLYPVNIFIPWDNFWFIPLRPYTSMLDDSASTVVQFRFRFFDSFRTTVDSATCIDAFSGFFFCMPCRLLSFSRFV